MQKKKLCLLDRKAQRALTTAQNIDNTTLKHNVKKRNMN